MAFVVILWIGCGIGGYFIGKGKGRAGAGLALGLLLGVIGLIIIAVMSPVPGTQQVQPQHWNPGGYNPTPMNQPYQQPYQQPSPYAQPQMPSPPTAAGKPPRLPASQLAQMGSSPSPAPNQTPAGWYPSPVQAGQLQYFDGSQWTMHFHPMGS